MSAFKVTPERLHQLADDMSNNSKAITDKLGTLESKVSRLRANWDGEAQRAYDEAQRSWNKSAEHINNILAEMSSKTHQIASRYSETDGRGARRFI